MKQIVDAFKAIVMSLYESSRQKSTIAILILAVLLIIRGLILSSTYNSLAVSLFFLGIAIFVIAYVYRWRDPVWFLILIGFSIVGFPLFVLLHNAFYAVGVISKNIYLLKSVFEVLHAISFIIATGFCPTGLVIGIIGLVVTLLLRWKKR